MYKSFPTFEALAKSLFGVDGGRLPLEVIAANADKAAFVTKKSREGSNWRMRYLIIRDNFLFYYKGESEPRSEPRGVLRLDDCMCFYTGECVLY